MYSPVKVIRSLRLIPFLGIKLQFCHFRIFTFFVIPFLGIKQHAQHADTISAHLNGRYAFANTQNNISTCVWSISQHLVIRDCLVAKIHVVILGPWCVPLTKIYAFLMCNCSSNEKALRRDRYCVASVKSWDTAIVDNVVEYIFQRYAAAIPLDRIREPTRPWSWPDGGGSHGSRFFAIS